MSNVAPFTLPDEHILQRDEEASHTFKVCVLSRAEVARSQHWARAFAGERKDHRYYELVEDTIQPEFDFRYFAIQDEVGKVWAVQPFFLLDQDMLAGTGPWIQAAAKTVRRLWPRFLQLRTLMVGCAAGEGHLDGSSDLPRHRTAELLAAGITAHARKLGGRLIVLKEFPAADRDALQSFLGQGFTRVPSMPMTRVGIQYASFDEYMSNMLSRKTRSTLRKKFKETDALARLEVSVVRDITPIIEEVYPLYLNVFERASMTFEKLTKAYFCDIGQRMPDKVRFFIWRHDGKIVAFGLCMVDSVSICAEYIGFDYEVAHRLNLYYIAVRDVMSWAIDHKYQSFRGTGLNYEPKLNLRYLLDPLDLYVKHTSPVLNIVFKYILPLMEPTRYDKTLKRFPNYAELWPPKS